MRDKINSNIPASLFGIGLDGADKHIRVTTGDNFYLYGGSDETHERMVETSIKLNEKLSKRGKNLKDVSSEEFRDLLSELSDL